MTDGDSAEPKVIDERAFSIPEAHEQEVKDLVAAIGPLLDKLEGKDQKNLQYLANIAKGHARLLKYQAATQRFIDRISMILLIPPGLDTALYVAQKNLVTPGSSAEEVFHDLSRFTAATSEMALMWIAVYLLYRSDQLRKRINQILAQARVLPREPH